MTPYREPRWLRTRQCALLLCLLVGVFVTRSAAADSGTKSKNSGKAEAQFQYATAKNDALTRSGFDHYYDLDYDDAVHDFEQVYKDHPRDPFAANHLVAALFFRELYRAGALETSLYTNNGFLNNRTPIHPEAKSAERIHS